MIPLASVSWEAASESDGTPNQNNGLLCPLTEDLRYWAPHPANRTEVDFLLRRGEEFVAIEVKSRPRYQTGMLPGLRAVAELPGTVRRVLVYGGRRSFRTEDGIEVWSTERLHRVLAEDSLWP